MAAVRARRGGRSPKETKRMRRSSGGGATPRLAAIKLDGVWRDGDEPPVTGRSLMVAVMGTVLFAGAAIGGATWIGGSLFDAGAAFQRSADGLAANTFFALDENAIEISGVEGARRDEVREAVNPDAWRSLLALDPDDVKARVEGLGWVQDAKVRRLWPSTIRIEVTRRQAFARWQEDGEISVIDFAGERLLTERAADHANLPLVVGRGAGPAAEPLLIALEDLPETRSRVRALVRVGERRWNIELASGATLKLPEQAPERALVRIESLQAEHRVLDRPVAELDMRAPGRLAVRVLPHLAGGPSVLAGGA